MTISRRELMWRLGAGAAATAALPRLAEASIRGERSIELDTNGNAFGPSPRTIATLREGVALANRCPAAESDRLRDTIAAFHGVKREQVVLGCGSGEILRMAVHAFTGRGRTLVTALPTFGLIGQYAARAGAEVSAVHLASDWSHDLPGMLARCDSTAGLVYICNPNNPTGSLTDRGDLERFLSRLPASAHVLIDEAYHHYVEPSSGYRSFIDQPVDDGRVIVTRSFSKIHGLVGLRVGYAIATPSTASLLAAEALDGNVNAIAAVAAAAALDDVEYVRRSRSLNTDDRQEFLNQANARMLRAIDSHANFVMMGTEHPVGSIVEQLSVDTIIDHFAQNNIALARPFPPLNRYVRVSLGTAAEMREFWRIWDLMPSHKM
jgi:histidinol-phosphate aminotransferase